MFVKPVTIIGTDTVALQVSMVGTEKLTCAFKLPTHIEKTKMSSGKTLRIIQLFTPTEGNRFWELPWVGVNRLTGKYSFLFISPPNLILIWLTFRMLGSIL
jgi:hypothetical protein